MTVIEKGRGVGGRMATRRMEGARIDHGAQFFTTRDQRLKELNKAWLQEDQVVDQAVQLPLDFYQLLMDQMEVDRSGFHLL